MNTKHAEYATAAERLTGETRSAIDRLRTNMVRRDTDMASTAYHQYIDTMVVFAHGSGP